MYKLTSNPNSDSGVADGVFDTIPEVFTYIYSQFRNVNRFVLDAQGPTNWDIVVCPIMRCHTFKLEEVSLTAIADEKIKELGLSTYDTALPIAWCDDVKAKTGQWPYHFVWGYGEGVFGNPIPLTPIAEKLLAAYNEACKNG